MGLKLKEGAFYEYEPDSRHAREGYAVAKRYIDSKELYLADTFWDITGRSSGLGWRFSEKEMESAVFLFDPTDETQWREATVNDVVDEYEPSDFHTITSQHGHYRSSWVRVGAEPSARVKLSKLNEEIAEAERKLQSAVAHLRHLSDRRAVMIHIMMEAQKK